jgi:hypothetical protein
VLPLYTFDGCAGWWGRAWLSGKNKIVMKADNTMGIMVSMSGYSTIAIREASRDKTALRLLDFTCC